MSYVEQNEYLSIDELQRIALDASNHYSQTKNAQVKLLCQSENATFMVSTSQEKFALRIHRPHYHSKQDILSELHWLQALQEDGMSVPEAILSQNNEYVLTLPSSDRSVRYAVLFKWINGDMPTTEVNPIAFKQLGEITARLHKHSKKWQKPDHFQRIIWNHDTMVSANSHWGDWRNAPYLKTSDHQVIDEAIHQIDGSMQQLGQTTEYYGLIHADLRLTNLLLQQGKIGVIDFDDCGMGWFMHDLAAAISFNEHHQPAEQWVEQWVNGYEKNAHISNEEYARIPAFIMQRRIQMLAWIGSHATTDMAYSLGTDWAHHTIRLCKKYLNNQLPVGI
ncbi:phosphotransferase enzyme family protein [Acinetobacter boissieri]|uniref:Ser/Thr protein kinase RdoA involved in Cpx stress response, MazF antagonist n=1 Tax=Acinetobacter boissieri TaxID=1219383 RepID=A0A1G6H8F2_9GAMM|nr:phosphotransferase [Acinetobacter boissieri]SDB89716.1 Ser/Thr protein kinase RdoA involved in Cpx stress response, MazF antagonist [Acinetobacter boissieri]